MPEIKCPKCGEVFTVDESGYAAIVAQVRDAEFHDAVRERIEQLNREKQNELKLVENKAEMDKAQSLASLNLEISNLKAQLITLGKDKDLEKARSVSGLQQEIEKLKAQILAGDKDKQLAVAAAVTSKNDEIVARDRQIAELNIKLRETAKDTLVKEQSLKENYELKLKEKDTQIEFYKDLKAKMSTKMVGETLEQHCEIEFNKLRATGFQKAYFEKDNDANFKKLVSKLISYDKTVDIDICLRKWRAFILWNLLSHLTSDYMQNLLEINEFWAEMGFPENVDHIYPSSKNISIYFTSVNCNRIIKKNTHWLHNEIAQIMKLQ